MLWVQEFSVQRWFPFRIDLCRALTASAQLFFCMADKPGAGRGAKADDQTFAGVMETLRVSDITSSIFHLISYTGDKNTVEAPTYTGCCIKISRLFDEM